MKNSFWKHFLTVFTVLVILCCLTACGLLGNDNPPDNTDENNSGGTSNPNPDTNPSDNNENKENFTISTTYVSIGCTETSLSQSEILALESVDISGYLSSASSGTIITEDMLDIDLSDVDTSVIGTYTAYATYKGIKQSFTIEVVEVPITGITAVTTNVQTEFKYGEEFNATGLYLMVEYDNGTQKEISDLSQISLDSSDYNKAHGNSTETSYPIRIFYNGYNAFYYVSVAAKPDDIIIGIEVDCSNSHQSFTYEYGELLSANDFLVKYVIETYDSDGKKVQRVTSELPENAQSHDTVILNNGGYNALHGTESDVTYTIEIGWGAFSSSIDVIVKKAPPHITDVVILTLNPNSENHSITVPCGNKNFIPKLNDLSFRIDYSYGDSETIYYHTHSDDFIFDETNFNYYSQGTYHIDVYYKGIRVKSMQDYTHYCEHTPSSQFGFDIVVTEKDYSHVTEIYEYLFIPSDSTHKIYFKRNETVSQEVLKQNLKVCAVDFNGNVITLADDEYELLFDNSSFIEAVPLRIEAGEIASVPTSYAQAVTVTLTSKGRQTYTSVTAKADAYADITYNVYRIPDRLVTSIVSLDNKTFNLDYATDYPSDIFAGLSFCISYTDGSNEVVTVDENGTLENFDGTIQFTIDIESNPLPDELFESGLVCDIDAVLSYDVYAYTGDSLSSETGYKTFMTAFSVTSSATVVKQPEYKGIYVDFSSSTFPVFYNDGDELITDGYDVYCYFDYSKQPHVKLDSTDYVISISSAYINNNVFITDITSGMDVVPVSVRYAPDNNDSSAYDYTINSYSNSSGARFNIYLLPGSFKLVTIDDIALTEAFVDITLEKTEYVVFIDDEISFENVSLDAYFLQGTTLIHKDITMESLLPGFKIVSDTNTFGENYVLNYARNDLPVYLAYAYPNEEINHYGTTYVDWIFACNSTLNSYALDISNLNLKTVYYVGDEFVLPSGNFIITENDESIIEKNIVPLLSVKPSDSIGTILEGVTVDYSTFDSTQKGTYTIPVKWMHHFNGTSTVMLETSYTVTVLENEPNTSLQSKQLADYAFINNNFESANISAPLYVYYESLPFVPTLSDTLSGLTYTLVNGLVDIENFDTASVISDCIITDKGYYTLRVSNSIGNVAYFYIENAVVPNVFTSFTINDKSITPYDETENKYNDVTVNLGIVDNVTVAFDIAGNYLVNVYDAHIGTYIASGDSLSLNEQSITLLVVLPDSNENEITSFYVNVLCGSPIIGLSVNGQTPTRRSSDGIETFNVTVPSNTSNLNISMDLVEGYSASISKNGAPYFSTLPLIGTNQYEVYISYYGKHVLTSILYVTVSKPDFFDYLSMKIDTKTYELSTSDTVIIPDSIPYAMPCKISISDPNVNVILRNLLGETVHQINGTPLALQYGKNEFYMEIIKDGVSYIRGLTLYKENYDEYGYAKYDISELTKRINVSAFGIDGVCSSNDSFFIPLPFEKIKSATVNSIEYELFNEYSENDTETMRISEITCVHYNPNFYRYACRIKFNIANNPGTDYYRYCYVYLVPSAPINGAVSAEIKLGDTVVSTNDFVQDDSLSSTYVKTVSVSDESFIFGIAPLKNATLTSMIILHSENGTVKSIGNETNDLLSSINNGLHDLDVLTLKDYEISVIFSVISEDKTSFAKYILVITR